MQAVIWTRETPPTSPQSVVFSLTTPGTFWSRPISCWELSGQLWPPAAGLKSSFSTWAASKAAWYKWVTRTKVLSFSA